MQCTGSASFRRLGAPAALAAGLLLLGQVAFPSSADAATTFTVSTTADVSPDSGACGDVGITTAPSPLSLREATCLADNLGGDVTIDVPAGVYNLTNGELRLGGEPGQRISLVGAGAAGTVIDAGGLSRVLEIDFNLTGGISASIAGVTVRGGSDATWGGAGIIAGSGTSDSSDDLTISASTITGNQTSPADAIATGYPGGGVQFVGGSLTITNSTISGNSSGNSPGSGVFYQGLGAVGGERLTITGSTFSGNSAVADGISNGGALAVGGAGYDISSSRFVNNTVTGSLARGAAIWAQSGALSVTSSAFAGNSAATGAAIAVDGDSAVLHYNRFAGNTAASGAALSAAVGAATDATENWWGCNTGPGGAGCDTVAGGPTVLPRLTLTAAANPATVVGPNATSTITATLTEDSAGAAVDPRQLGAFDAVPVGWSGPQPSGASVSSTDTAISAGSAAVTYDSRAAVGAGHVVATLDHGTATAGITVVRADQPPVITSADRTTFTAGSAGTFTVTTTAGSPSATTLTETGTLPAGVTFTDNGDGTATIAGTPAAGTGGSYSLTITASNGVLSSTQSFTLTVNQPPAITSPDHTTFSVGHAGSFAMTTAAGYPTATALTESGPLPAGVTFADNGNGSATLAGTPAIGTGGSYPLTLTATNAAGSTRQAFTLTVAESPVITSANHTTFTAGVTGTFTVTTAGGYPTSTMLTESGALPAGLTFRDNGNGTATLSGNAVNGGSYAITITASNRVSAPVSQGFTLTVQAPPPIG